MLGKVLLEISRVKAQIKKFNVQCSKFKGKWVQRIKRIREIREIRSYLLNLFYIIVKEMVVEMVKNDWFQYLYKSVVFKQLQRRFPKGAYLGSKRALVRVLKGTFCKPISRLLEGKRACISFEILENSLQIPIIWE